MGPGRRWLVCTISGRRLAAVLMLAAAGVAFVAALRLYDALVRLVSGVKPGVMLGEIPVGGLLPEELRRRLLELQPRLGRPPVDARWDPASGGVLPEQPGRVLDVAETERRLLAAGPYQRVQPAYVVVLPSVSRRHFRAIYRGPQHRPWVALAFNVDWGQEHVGALLDQLDRRRVRATFFLTGRWARRFAELTREIAARGHEIGNHGMEHVHPKELTDAALRQLVLDAEHLLEQLTGQRTRLFAPPYGEVDQRIVRVAAQLGYYTILWTIDTLDWQQPPAELILQRVRQGLGNGAIILMHPTQPTVQALPQVLELVSERGLEVVTVGRMAEGEAEEFQT